MPRGTSPHWKHASEFIGVTINYLTIIDFVRAKSGRNRPTSFVCRCVCGKIVQIRRQSVTDGHTKSCGCMASTLLSAATSKRHASRPPSPPPARVVDAVGKVFNFFTVQSYSPPANNKSAHWMLHCICVCGTKKIVRSDAVIKGGTKSCGCQKGAIISERTSTHGMKGTPEYMTFESAKGRCTRPSSRNYHLYGGRGIQMKFESFEEFFEHIGPRPSPNHSLDRIDVNGHYEPGNVRWATFEVQSNNKRTSRTLTYGGETLSFTQWSRRIGRDRHFVRQRIKAGYPVEIALNPDPIPSEMWTGKMLEKRSATYARRKKESGK